MLTASYKIGLDRGRRRIWLDGKRLADAGFTPGSAFYCHHSRDGQGLLLSLEPVPDAQVRKVSGRPNGKPLIDIVGRTVAEAFPADCERVLVTFLDGVITIVAHAAFTASSGACRRAA